MIWNQGFKLKILYRLTEVIINGLSKQLFEVKSMHNRLRLVIWIPRILNLVIGLAFIILSLEHLYDHEKSYVQSWNFYLFFSPGILMILLLIISWRQPLAGGILFTAAALTLLFIDPNTPFINPFSLPLIITGLFYLISHWIWKRGG